MSKFIGLSINIVFVFLVLLPVSCSNAETINEKVSSQLLAPDFVDPLIWELDAWTLPLQLMGLYFSLDKDDKRQELLDLVSNHAPGISTRLACLLKAVQEVGYETREDCVRLMVKCHNCFLALDSCLVVDPKEHLVYQSSGPRKY